MTGEDGVPVFTGWTMACGIGGRVFLITVKAKSRRQAISRFRTAGFPATQANEVTRSVTASACQHRRLNGVREIEEGDCIRLL